jgi:hypothetical protein
VKAALRARLLADGTISGLVGTRIDWGLRPQGMPLPAITLTLIPTPRDYHMGGAQRTQHYLVQIDCWASSYASADAVRQAVIAELEPASGSFQGSFVQRDHDMPERIETSEIHRASLDFKITYISA